MFTSVSSIVQNSISSVGKSPSLILSSSLFPLLSSSTLEYVSSSDGDSPTVVFSFEISLPVSPCFPFLIFLPLSPTGGTKPGCGWSELTLFLLLFGFLLPPLPLLRLILPHLNSCYCLF